MVKESFESLTRLRRLLRRERIGSGDAPESSAGGKEGGTWLREICVLHQPVKIRSRLKD